MKPNVVIAVGFRNSCFYEMDGFFYDGFGLSGIYEHHLNQQWPLYSDNPIFNFT